MHAARPSCEQKQELKDQNLAVVMAQELEDAQSFLVWEQGSHEFALSAGAGR